MADEDGERKPFPTDFYREKNHLRPPMQPPLRPKGIRAPHGAKIFEISWPDVSHRLPHSILRGYCPCAGCQGHSGEIAFQAGHNLDLREIKPVGNYALCLVWGDHHDSGIYSFEYLRQLGDLLDDLGEQGLIDKGTLPRGKVTWAKSDGE